jgi:hypothetical protein
MRAIRVQISADGAVVSAEMLKLHPTQDQALLREQIRGCDEAAAKDGVAIPSEKSGVVP